MIPHGYHRSALCIDVSTGNSDRIGLENSVLRDYLGGSGLGAWLLLRSKTADVDPLSAASPLCFVFSPLVGSPLTTSAKFAVVCKSPLTGRFNDALCSSRFAIDGKRTGCDAIIMIGRAETLSVLIVDDGQVRIEAAPDLAGCTTSETQRILKDRYGKDFSSAVIGPAGEAGVLFATISHDGRHAGRGGSGAVMGAKNIKAILVRGNHRCEWADPVELTTYAKDLSEKSFGPATAKYRELGTAGNMLLFNRLAALPTRNFQHGSFDGAAQLAPENLSLSREKTRASCAACTIGCEHIYSLGDKNGKSGGVRLEYENLFALGSLCAVQDSEAVLTASSRCDELGLDTISTGGTIAFAAECVERGLLNEPWLTFGDGGALLKAIEQIADQTTFGKTLAQGCRRMAHQIGHDSIHFAAQVKGLELPGYDPRAMQTMSLGFAVNARGADHNRSSAYEVDFSENVDRRHATIGAVRLAIETEDRAAILDSLILCKFLRGVFDDFFAEAATMLRLVTGWDATSEELHNTAARIIDAKKRFNIQAGWTADEDTLPERFFSDPLPEDPQARLSKSRFTEMVSEYYRQRHWTTAGRLAD